jgi:hypothetical protein
MEQKDVLAFDNNDWVLSRDERTAALPNKQILKDAPEWHGDPEKSSFFILANKRKTGKAPKIIIRHLREGWQTEIHGEKAILVTYGFAIQSQSLRSLLLYRLLDGVLKLGKFQSIFMTKLEIGDAMRFEKGRASVERGGAR